MLLYSAELVARMPPFGAALDTHPLPVNEVDAYEILLPLRYNDGRPTESAKFDQTNLDLIERFAATTTDVIPAVGRWRYRGALYEDLVLRLIIDVPASEPADEFVRNCKEVLKVRFEQIDIWISSHEIQIL